MKRPFIFFTALLLSAATRSLSYNEDEVLSRDGDFTYLDYVKAREQEYEYAMHLRDAMWRDGGRGQGPDDDDDDDDGFEDEQDYGNDGPRSYDDEGGSEDRDDKSKRNLKTEGRWKEHDSKKDNMKTINTNHKDRKLEDSKVSNYIEKKQDKYSSKKKKDFKNLDGSKDIKSGSKSDKEARLQTSSDKSLKEGEGNVLENRGSSNDKSQLSVKSMSHGVKNEKDGTNPQNDGDPSTIKRVTTTATPESKLPAAKPITKTKKERKMLDKALFVVVVAACSVAGVAGLVLAGYCWYRLRTEQDAIPEEDTKKYVKKKKKAKKDELTNDEKLAKSAEVFHYMHTKKQLTSMEKNGSQRKTSSMESETSDEESDNTVYECPGLAPPGDMKVVNPLFSDAEKEHSDARSDGSHISSPSRDKSPPQNEAEEKAGS